MKTVWKKAVALMLAVSLSGCAGWVENFKKDPVTQIQNIVQGVETAISIAVLIFGQVKPTLPPEEQVKAQAEMDKSLFAVRASVSALQLGLNAAVDAGKPNPDLGKLVSDLGRTLDALKSIVDTYAGTSSLPGAGPTKKTVVGYDVFVRHVASVKARMPQALAATSQ